MPRTESSNARQAIMQAAESLVRTRGARGITIDAVAKQAGCAKGLVHYHYKTKKGLLEAVARHVAQQRTARWQSAFSAPTPRAAIDRSWELLTNESAEGDLKAWLSLFEPGASLSDQAVRDAFAAFAETLGVAVTDMMEGLGLRLSISPTEVGWHLGSVVNGMGLQLLSGADRDALEGAYAAAWLGVLSLGQPGSA
jgi:AcrR family transcriptional regulator